jgi:hypothetical protein
VFDADTTLCAFCKANGLTWTLITCEVNHVTKVQACRPADRAMLSSEAGQELLQAAQEFLGDPRDYSGLETRLTPEQLQTMDDVREASARITTCPTCRIYPCQCLGLNRGVNTP